MGSLEATRRKSGGFFIVNPLRARRVTYECNGWDEDVVVMTGDE
jgi:hypothetical protein